MSAGMEIGRDLQPDIVTTPLTSLPSTARERFDASWADAQTNDHYWNFQAAQRDRAQKIIDDLHGLTGEKLRNPYDNSPTMDEVRANVGQPVTKIYADRLNLLRQKAAEAKGGLDPGVTPQGFLDVDSIDAGIGQESGAARARNENLTGTGNGLAAFAGSSLGSMASPHGVASMFLPVSRMPLATAEGIAAGWLRNVGREALVQGAGQLAAQAVGTAIDYGTRKPLGTEQTPGEIAEELLGAAAGGAVLGGAFRGVHLGIRKLMGHGLEVPPAVKDAAIMMESADLYGDKNALKIPTAAYEQAFDKATGDVAMGRAAQVADIAQPAPRPSEVLPTAPPPEPVKPFAEALEEKRDEVWADKSVVGGIKEGSAVNEGFVTEEARARVMQAEAADMMEKSKQVFDFNDDDLKLIGRQYERGENETPAEAFVRTADAYVTAQERDAIHADGTFDVHDAAFVADPNNMVGRDPALQKLFEAVYPKGPVAAAEQDIPFPTFTAPEPTTAGRPATAASPQDATRDAQVRQLVSEEGPAPAHLKKAYEDAMQAEKEANIATGCVGGGSL